MGKRKKRKNNSSTPRHKRLKRSSRLQAARHWIPKYEGKDLVKGYSKHFAVNKFCAVKELEMLGHTFKGTYKQKLKDAEIQKQREAEKRNAAKKQKRHPNGYRFIYPLIAPSVIPFEIRLWKIA
ncbi:hypothetical protein J2Z83_003708 [Virgibacillus natechei]|uniref:Uncharacterized protein n=1 Tax=Virgibacillus natechei TaxID=1216297 RepID=A0ABS4IKR0_9BACI|nr:hypothetical protein [Virgibacillus natechei]MBP1971557.1 hypothetical protein [Virgibacillus natechei]UZD11973.1 hypothetical protein OLD84_13630 [Virgibacillus natechei]